VTTASELAGFIAAHAIWCVSDADGFTPMLGFAMADGQRQLERLITDDVASAVQQGWQRLADERLSANDGVLACDGRIRVVDGKLDAILLEMRSYAFPWAKATIAVPYSPRSSGRFRVHRPKLVEWHECEDFDLDAALEAFFRGVAAHQHGARVWNTTLDESK